MFKIQACLVAIVFNLLLCRSAYSLPAVYYANMGDTVSIQCNGGPYACFSTYTLQNSQFSMVPLNQSAKYQVAMGSIVINNVQATDAGFYACSSNCYQMNINQISYYLQPMANGQPVDTSASFIPIPPYPNQYGNDFADNKYFVVIPNENSSNDNGGLSGGEIAALVIGLVIAAVIFIAIIVFLCLLYFRKNKSGEKKLIQSEIKNDKDGQSSVDYSTIERDYNPDNTGSTVNTSSREPMGRSSHQNSIISKHSDRDGERKSLASNKQAQSSSNPATESATSIGNLANIVGEINTKYMKGPSTYQPNELTLISPQDLPNIDIGFSKTNSQRSQQPTYNNYSNRSFQVDQVPQQQVSYQQQPPPSGKGRIQFPTRPNRPQNVPVPQQHSQIPQSVSASQRYVTNESMNLKNIPKDSMRSEPADDPHKNQQYEGVSDQEGGVTVVSARTPARNGENNQPVVYSNVERQPAPVNRHHHHNQQHQQQQQPGQKLPPHLSYSQRIETTSTPLHHVPPPSASVRNTQHTNQAFSLKDGSTDV